MTIIDTKQNKSYPGLNCKQAAKLVGISIRTVQRWKKSKVFERFNHFTIYFCECHSDWT
jgi:hypothetical protein